MGGGVSGRGAIGIGTTTGIAGAGAVLADAINADSGTKRNPRSRRPWRIVGSASAVFQPRPLM